MATINSSNIKNTGIQALDSSGVIQGRTLSSANSSITISNGDGTAGNPSVTAVDASDVQKGVASFDSGDFTVTAGNVVLNATGVGQTITGDTGGALSPSGGNWSILGGSNGIDTAGSGSTLTLNFDVTETSCVTSMPTSSGTATPSSNAITIVGSGTVSTSASGSTITVTGTGGGLTWSVITANQSAVANNGYICNKAGRLDLTLPASSSIGDVIKVTGINTAVGWRIAQNANQQIFVGTSSTTVGTGGSVTSINIRDSIEIVCVVSGSSSAWNFISGTGNYTIV